MITNITDKVMIVSLNESIKKYPANKKFTSYELKHLARYAWRMQSNRDIERLENLKYLIGVKSTKDENGNHQVVVVCVFRIIEDCQGERWHKVREPHEKFDRWACDLDCAPRKIEDKYPIDELLDRNYWPSSLKGEIPLSPIHIVD